MVQPGRLHPLRPPCYHRRAIARVLAALRLTPLLCFVLACGASPSRPNVLLITVDTLRPDALGWVAGHGETPAIDALAAEGFRFPAAVTPTPLTLPAHASLLTAVVPVEQVVAEPDRVEARRLGGERHGGVLGPAHVALDLGQLHADAERRHRDFEMRSV